MNSVRIKTKDWIKQFKAGAYLSPECSVQVAAGWDFWFCSDKALVGKTRTMGRIIAQLTSFYILTNTYTFFRTEQEIDGTLHDDIYICKLTTGRPLFIVSIYSSRRRFRYVVYESDTRLFESSRSKEVVKWLNMQKGLLKR